jgi:NADH-ubiquinone oxidoreductase chain 2
MPKISILIFLLEILIGLDINLLLTQLTHPFIYSLTEYTGGEWGTVNILTNLLLLSSLLSLLIGSIVGLRQVRIKRLLAYSTINHIGFLLLALSVFSNYSIEAFIFYIFQYTITNLNIFLIILAFGYVSSASTLVRKRSHPCASDPFTVRERGDKTEEERLFITSDVEYISTLKGKFFENPLLSISLSISLFSFAGVPPLIGFFAKQQVLYSSNSAGYFFLSLVAILVSIISASYYLKIINVMLTPDTIHTTSSLPFFCIPTLKTGSVSEHDDYIAEAGKLNIKESENNTHTLSNLIDGTVLEDKGKLILDHTVKQNNNYIYNIKAISSAGKLSNTHSFIIGILTLSIIFFIFNPEILLNCIAIVSSLILNL